MPTIKLKNIYKKYEGNEDYTVTDFNLDIEDKEFIVFVGPSGCGKSTTLRMVAGLEEITKGDLIIDGQRINDLSPKDREIAMVFQNYALYPQMTVYDNMAFSLQLKKEKKAVIDEKVHYASKILGLEDYLDRKPGQLSGGQRQRVALGRAIVKEAKVFLMDEPLSNLDAKLRVKMRAEIARLHKALGTTSIYVTHDQTEAMTMASRIVVMKDGFIQQIGSPKEVYDHPENVFVAGFIGSPASNFLKLKYQDGYVCNEKGIKLKVTEPQKKLLEAKGYSNKELIMSIRPEDIHAEQIYLDSNQESKIEAKVTVFELLGSETILYIDIEGDELIAKLNARDNHQVDDKIELVINMNKAHFFDVESEKAIK